MRNESYITAAYVITWVTLIGYAVYLRRVARRARDLFDETRPDTETRR